MNFRKCYISFKIILLALCNVTSKNSVLNTLMYVFSSKSWGILRQNLNIFEKERVLSKTEQFKKSSITFCGDGKIVAKAPDAEDNGASLTSKRSATKEEVWYPLDFPSIFSQSFLLTKQNYSPFPPLPIVSKKWKQENMLVKIYWIK